MTARRLARRAPLTSVVCAVLLAGMAAGPARAAGDSDGGMWYYTKTGMEKIHQRATGKGVHVAIIDTAIAPDSGDLAGTDLTVHEPSFCADEQEGENLPAAQDTPAAAHGTGMSALVVGTGKGVNGEPGTLGIAPDATVTFYSALVGPTGTEKGVCESPGDQVGEDLDAAMLQAIDDGADIISISLNSTAGWGYDALLPALAAGVIVVAGVTSDDESSALGFPARFNGVVSVDSIGPDGKVWGGAPPGSDVVAPGEQIRQLDDDLDGYSERNGSSNATAYTAAALALVKSAYPDATTNQLLQALARNTNGEEHEIYRDEYYGFGAVNVRQMLEQDPAKYPDWSPFLTTDPWEMPTYDEVMAFTAASAEPTTTPSATATAAATPQPTAAPSTAAPVAAQDDETSSTGLVWAGLGALALAGIATTLILLARRNSGPSTSTATSTTTGGGDSAAAPRGGTIDQERPHDTGGG